MHTKQRVIKHMKEAYDIHMDWARLQEQRRRNNLEPLPYAGGATFHRKWAKIYTSTITALEK